MFLFHQAILPEGTLAQAGAHDGASRFRRIFDEPASAPWRSRHARRAGKFMESTIGNNAFVVFNNP
ncbi:MULTISPECIES: hypothetical protein [Burkholderia]|uniref:hypothetical protein n=1 Tax=Burkholderia TaxID=32008 RepID=UPI00157AC369|nr:MULTISPECIES: hypothetical protein [Burkholderia]MCU9953490.1 hypothetical protein [Burkholderia sp. BKH01]NTY35398.1 hypothetical protein [Burkholderia diffusa]